MTGIVLDSLETKEINSLLKKIISNHKNYSLVEEFSDLNDFEVVVFLKNKETKDLLSKDVKHNVVIYLYDKNSLSISTTNYHSKSLYSVFPNLKNMIKKNMEYQLLKNELQNVKKKLFHDSLTGLPNRLLVEDRLSQALREAERNNNYAAVVWLDLDNFKFINDNFGHEEGDKILIKTAEILKQNLRKIDTVARFGGDEFILILPGVNKPESVNLILDRVRNALMTIRTTKGTQPCGCSMGVSVYPNNSKNVAELIKIADLNLLKAKSDCKGNYVIDCKKWWALRDLNP